VSDANDPKRRQLSLFDEPPPAPAPPERLSREIENNIPDVRDGLTRVERVILLCLKQAQEEKHGRMVSTAMLYGRVVEHVDISVPEFQRILQRLVGVR
jgi:hypothetical protein